jgi:putative transposon-encoded protein
MKLRSKWDVVTPTKVEGKPSAFGTSCHVILPKAWLKKVVVTVTKETWDEMSYRNDSQSN